MFLLKSCKRCHGDLHGELDDELVCLQCGHEVAPEERERLAKQVRSLQPAVAQASYRQAA